MPGQWLEEKQGIDTTNLTASQIDNLKVAKQKEYQIALNNLHLIEIKELRLARLTIKLQARRKDLQIAISKAKHIVRTLAIDIRILESAFWQTKDGR